MSRCQRCEFENANTSIYCEKCGAFLQTFVEYKPSMREHIAEQPSYQAVAEPTPDYPQYQVFAEQNQKIRYRRSRLTAFSVVRTIFYFVIAVPIATFGLFSSITTTSEDIRVANLALFLGLGLIVTSVVVYFRTRGLKKHLKWISWIWWTVGATVGVFMAMILETVFFPNITENVFASMIFGGIILLYGLVLAFAALY